MNYACEIYKRENLPCEEWSKIERSAGGGNHKTFEQHKKDWEAKQDIERELTDYLSWEDYTRQQAISFLNGEIETE